jgi:hypothetical protein
VSRFNAATLGMFECFVGCSSLLPRAALRSKLSCRTLFSRSNTASTSCGAEATAFHQRTSSICASKYPSVGIAVPDLPLYAHCKLKRHGRAVG